MQRAYRDDMQCRRCGSNRLSKAGLSRGKQTYRCGECLHRFTPESNRSYYPVAIKRQAIPMYAEGMGYSAISRVLGVKPETIYSWVKKAIQSMAAPEAARAAAVASWS